MGLFGLVDLGAICRLPEAKPLPYVKPSGAVALRECLLRVAYGTDDALRQQVASSPAARLGLASHRVLEQCAKGLLPPGSDADFDAAFEVAWADAINQQASAAANHPAERHWPPPERWRNYAMRKVATKLLARRISFSGGSGGGSGGVRVEQSQEAASGRIRGRADVIRRSPVHEIEDYKSGALYEEDTGELKPSYKTQMLLYAVLEHADTGQWPVRASLIPLVGEPAAIEVVPAEAEAEAGAALSALNSYNGSVSSVSPEELARPSPDHCRFCEYAVSCPAFWSTVSEDWRDGAFVAAAGYLRGRESAQRGAIALHVEVVGGSVENGAWTIERIDPDRFAAAAHAELGSAFALTSALARDDAQTLRPTDRSRMIFSTQDRGG